MERRFQPLGRIIGDADKPVVTVEDNGFPTIYHPSERRTDLCSNNKLLIIPPGSMPTEGLTKPSQSLNAKP